MSSHHSTILSLPVEVIAYTILQLDAQNISICRQLCRFLRNLIDTSPAILYHTELSISSTIDAPLNTLSKSKKLDLLRKRNKAWSTLRPRYRFNNIPVNNYAGVYELANGFFFQDINKNVDESSMMLPSRVTWLELPSSSRAYGRRGEWKFDFKVADLCLDVDRDLLILVERLDKMNDLDQRFVCFKLHFRTLSTNEKHPEAKYPYQCAQFQAYTLDYSMIIQLSGDHVGLLLSTRHVRGEKNDVFFLWDWKMGSIKGEINSNEQIWDTFCFISPDALLLPDTSKGHLNLYAFQLSNSSSGCSVYPNLSCVTTLALPNTKSGVPLAHIACRTDPPSTGIHTHRSSLTTATKSFHTSPADSIIVVTLDYLIAPPPLEGMQLGAFVFDLTHTEVFVIQKNTLRRYVDEARARKSVPFCMSDSEGFFGGFKSESQVDNGDLPVPLSPTRPRYASYTAPTNPPYPIAHHNYAPYANHPSATPLYISPKSWLPFSRWGLDPPPPRWVCYTHGSRYISMQDREFGSRARVRVKVYDFNIDLGRRESARGPDSRANLDHSDLPGCAPDSLAASMHTYTPTSLVPPLSLRLTKTVMAPSLTDDRRAIFAEPFESALPYRVIETEQVFDWDSAMIDDERIIGLREEVSDIGGLDSFDVLAF